MDDMKVVFPSFTKEGAGGVPKMERIYLDVLMNE